MSLHRFAGLLVLLGTSVLGLHAGPVFYTMSFGDAPALGTIDPNTGTVTPIGAPLTGFGHDITVSPSGAVYEIIDDNLFSINKTTGVSALIGALPTDAQSLAFRSDGTLFVGSHADLYTVNPLTAAGTLIGSMNLPASADNIRFGPSGNLYVMSAEANSGLYLLNTSTGASTFVGLSGQDDISLGAFYNGVFLGTNAPVTGQMVTVNPATGAATIGAPTNGIYLFALDPTSVPEPGTFGLLLAGAGLLCFVRRNSEPSRDR
jgi:outer membrane protein assembly factor BamB